MTLRLNGSTSGYTEIDAPAVAGSNTLVLPTGAGSAYQVVRNGATAGSLEFTDNIVSGTAQASTSGTAINFTGIPSWVKRVTVMMNGVSTNGSSQNLIQFGAGSVATTGYTATSFNVASGTVGGPTLYSQGFGVRNGGAANTYSGSFVLSLVGSNSWVGTGCITGSDTSSFPMSGSVTLSGTLDRVRITTVNGTDTFDAGSINLLYE